MIDTSKLTGIIDLDALLHIVAHVQYSAGNRDNAKVTKSHVFRFINTIKKNANCKNYIQFYQGAKHKNFRNDLLPEYKGHRTTADAIKCWKSTILEAFEESGAIELKYIESDDAVNVVAATVKQLMVVITSDKDMKQVPSFLYNPFKKGPALDPSRWYCSEKTAQDFFWAQVMAGDATDMPNEFCGIPGVGINTAMTLIKKNLNKKSKNYIEVVANAYRAKMLELTPQQALSRATLTFRMVRLLNGTSSDNYANDNALKEVEKIKNNYKKYIINPEADFNIKLFGNEPLVNLFK